MAHPFLEYLIKLTEEKDITTTLSLCVHGVIIQGATISQKQYYEDMWTELTNFTPINDLERNTEMINKLNSYLRDFMQSESVKEKSDVPEYIHLKNVRIYSGSNKADIAYWVGKLSSVDAFWIGGPSEDDEKSE